MVEKVGFTNCVFEKLCFPENTIFIVFSAKYSFSKTKTVCWKKTENLWKIVGCFWTWQNGVFWGLLFWGEVLILKGLFLVCLVLFQVLKNACFFPVFWFFSGVAHCCSSGFGRVRCFCVSCVCFSFLSCFCFCFVCFVLGFVVGCCCLFLFVCFCCFFVVFLFLFVFVCFCLFLFVFVCFCLFLFVFVCFCLFLFVFLEGLRVMWGGPKGHLTWP